MTPSTPAPEPTAKQKKIDDAARTIETAILKADTECGYKRHLHRLFNEALRALEFLEKKAKPHA